MMTWTTDLAAEYARLTASRLSPRHVAQAMGLPRSCVYDHARVLRRAGPAADRQPAGDGGPARGGELTRRHRHARLDLRRASG